MTEYERRRQSAESLVQAACPPLEARGVTKVYVNYDGACDAGVVAPPQAHTADGAPIQIPQELGEPLREAVRLLLPGGWDTGHGVWGRFVLDVSQRTFVNQPQDEPPPGAVDSREVLRAAYAMRVATRQQAARQSLADICAALGVLQVARVVLTFEGDNDSGEISQVTAFDAAEEPFPLDSRLHHTLLRDAELLLPGGWEKDAGGWGQFVLDVPGRTITRRHHWRVESTEYEEETHTL